MKKMLIILGLLMITGCMASNVEFNNPNEKYNIDISKETLEDKEFVLNKNDEMQIEYDLEYSPNFSNIVGDMHVKVKYKGNESVQRFTHISFIDSYGPVIEACEFPYFLQNSKVNVEDIVNVYDILYKQEKLIYPKANYFAFFNSNDTLNQKWDAFYQEKFFEPKEEQGIYSYYFGYIVKNRDDKLVGNYQTYDVGNDAIPMVLIDTNKLGKQEFKVSAIDHNGNISEKTIEIEIVDEARYNELKQ